MPACRKGASRPSAARAAISGAAALITIALVCAARPVCAFGLSLSPLQGARDASPDTQISFLGAVASEITQVSVVGSLSGRHNGQLEPYVSAPGASFVLAHPFAQGERVTATAVVGRGEHARRVRTTFEVARPANYPIAVPAEASARARPAAAAPAGAVQSFVSQPSLQPPSVQVLASSPAAAPGDVFLAPSHGYGQLGPMILDERGQLVWFSPAPKGEIAEDFQVQNYQGQPVLVWWQGTVPPLGVGFGSDVIYNSSYQQIATVSAGNGYWADLHDIQITPSGSAFITAYSLIRADLSSAGGSHYGTLADAIVQEIDISTGLVMFEWHAYDHVPLTDSYSAPSSSPTAPWDYFHVNSISLDPSGDGDFLISARNTWAAYEIDSHTGAVLWRLGGKRSSFRMGPGTGTAWQHDVRWQPDGTLTIFDNGATPKEHSQSRVIRERIDWRRRAVTLVGRIVHRPAILAGSQGNSQLLANGDAFVGWGEEPYVSEFSPTGQLLFEARLPPTGQSYRAFRFPWSATPATAPAIAVRPAEAGSITVYASWNGATAVSAWRVLGGANGEDMTPLATAARSGFETAVALTSGDAYFAVQALGAGGEVLGSSSAVAR